MYNIQSKKMKQFIIPVLTSSLFLASCGGGSTESLADLKAKQAELKTQLSEISTKISKLEGDSGKAFTLVEALPIVPSIFKTYINVQGRVDAEESVSLASEMPGTITKINVKAGDEVSKGQVLAETDARALQQSISDLQTNAELVNQLYEKQKALWDQKIGTEVQFLQAKTQKESMEKKMATLQEQVRMTKIISPINGTIDAVDIKLGQLTAPISSSLIQKDLKGSPFVLLADGKKAMKRDIVIGKEYNGRVEVKDGLSETDLLITSGYDGLNDGDAIEIKK